MPFGLVAFVIIGFYLLSSIKILREYERGVIFRLGRMLAQPKGPGIILVFWPLDTIMRISLQQEALEVPPQDTITRDNVTLKVNAVITLRVIDPNRAVVQVSNYRYQTSLFAQTTLRSVIGEVELDELLAHRQAEFAHPEHPRWAHRTLGREGGQRGSEAGGSAGEHAARHGQAGGGGTREARQDHPRGRRIQRRPAAHRGGGCALQPTHDHAIALPANAD